MAVPSVFVSSTWYDLRYIRENLKYFISTLGYNPILSEEGTVYFDPATSVAEACVTEIPHCQMFVLIIGGRFGEEFKDSGKSITNAEYEEAVTQKIPVFALVEQGTFNDHQVFVANRDAEGVDEQGIVYPNVDSTAIFRFIEHVRQQSVNNALVPFRNFMDIETYLRLQWAGMLHSFLTKKSEEARLSDTLDLLTAMNERIAVLSNEILNSVGTKIAQLSVKLYDEMLASKAARDLTHWGIRPTPASILRHSTVTKCAESFGVVPDVDDEIDGFSIGGGGHISRSWFDAMQMEYAELRQRMRNLIKTEGMSVGDYLKEAADSVQPRQSPHKRRRVSTQFTY